MNEDNLLVTLSGLLSLPLSQFLITKFQLTDEYIALYWFVLGLLCTFTLVRSCKIVPKTIPLRGAQVSNFILGGFGLVTSSLIIFSTY